MFRLSLSSPNDLIFWLDLLLYLFVIFPDVAVVQPPKPMGYNTGGSTVMPPGGKLPPISGMLLIIIICKAI